MLSHKRVTVTATLALTLFLNSGGALAHAAQKGAESGPRFHVSINTPGGDGPGLKVPARAPEAKQMFALLPARPEVEEAGVKERPSYVKVAPRLEGGSVRVGVFVLFGELEKGDSAAQVKKLREEMVVSVLLAEGETVTVSELKRFGVRPITLEAVAG